MVFRVYTERRPEFSHEEDSLLKRFVTLHGVKGLERIRLLRRYDVENVSETTFTKCIGSVFSDPRTENALRELPDGFAHAFAAEYLPGQYDQCADAAEQSIRLIGLGSEGEKPTVRTARVYLLYGSVSDDEVRLIKSALINPVDSREGGLEMPKSLARSYDEPEGVSFIEGFRGLDDGGLSRLIAEMGLAMDLADAVCCRDYFR
ncbi:MAG: phosphoribosylformylglycinamidine synthase, partial [Clostridia bacterium]|nr:phosphoribosylformylglycinamidine synthase [Clostridia bacterium]